MKVAIVGVTGLVGSVMLKVLEEKNFPVETLIPVASARSVGKQISFAGKQYAVVDMETAIGMQPDIALFSAGGVASREWAPKFAAVGTKVIDNSSAWRMDPNCKLVVPEVNGYLLTEEDRIIANPNCSTIQMVLALFPLHKNYGIDRLVVATYQSVSGSGVAGIQQLEDERNGVIGNKAYPHNIDKNCLPHGGDFTDNGYTVEEMKLVHETRKILGDDSIRVTATVVRVPVEGGHSEAVNVALKQPFNLNDVRSLLENTAGITVQDDPQNNVYPMPLHAAGKDDVFVGRLRQDSSNPDTLDMWVVSDNLRKGAATNAVQIAEYLLREQLAWNTSSNF